MRESDFVNKLSDFTNSLESLVDLLKEQQKTSPTETLNKMLEGLDGEAIATISANLLEVKENVETINKNTEKTLEIVKSIKSENETGMFGKIEDPKNKNTILQGVKTVLLIAAGVLAIGMAFKIVGSVDYFSVVALGMAIMFSAHAFAQVASIKDDKGKPITYKVAFQTAIIMAIMSAAILASGLIFKVMPTLSIYTLITVIGIGLAMGLSTFFILKGIGKLNKKSLGLAFMVPLIIPLIALGIVAASLILQYVQPISPEVLKNVVLTSIGIGLITLAMMPTLFLLEKSGLTKNIAGLALGGLAIVIISTAIMLSSWVLSIGRYGNAPNAEWALGTGLSIIMFTPALVLLGVIAMTGVGIPAMLLGGLGVVIVSTAIMIASHILDKGKYKKYPTLGWATGVGLALLVFGTPMIALGTMILLSLGTGMKAIEYGKDAMLMVATTLVEASKILSKGKWGKYPSFKWSRGVGLALKAFSDVLVTLTRLQTISSIFGGKDIILTGKDGFITKASNSLVEAGKIFTKSGDVFTKGYPSEDWAKGVGISLVAFADVMSKLERGNILDSVLSVFGLGGNKMDLLQFIKDASNALVEAGTIFSQSDNVFSDNYPSEDWALGVGGSLVAFADVIQKLDDASRKLIKEPWRISSLIKTLSLSMVHSGVIFTKYGSGLWNKGTYPSEDWALGVGGSLTAFADAIQKIDDARSKLIKNPEELQMLILTLASTLIKTGLMFTKYGSGLFNLDSVPSEDWSTRIGAALATLGEVSAIENIDKLTQTLYVLSTVSFDKLAENITNVGKIIEKLSDSINTLDVDKVNNLVNLSSGFQMLGLVDHEGLKKTLKTINAEKNELKTIQDNNGVMSGAFNKLISKGSKTEGGTNVTTASKGKNVKNLFEDKMLDFMENIDQNVEKIANPEEREEELEGKDVEDN